jgi:hypothetical protein
MSIPGSVIYTLGTLRRYTRFLEFLENQPHDLARRIDEMRGVTIFAPTDEAWDGFEGGREKELEAIILNHIVAERVVYSSLLKSQGSMITMGGQDLIFDSRQGILTVGEHRARIRQFDIIHRGGVIHSIDRVLSSTFKDSHRASQASKSAFRSHNSLISGPVSALNAASSQGDRVPSSDNEAESGLENFNIHVHVKDLTYNGHRHDAIAGTVYTGQKGNGAMLSSRQDILLMTIVSLTAILFLFII